MGVKKVLKSVPSFIIYIENFKDSGERLSLKYSM